MKNKTTLLLMEQAILLAVFALVAAVCLRLFVWADSTSKLSAATDEALLQVQSAADVTAHYTGDLEKAAAKLGGQVDSSVWTVCQNEGYTVQVRLLPSQSSYLGSAQVTATGKDGTVLAQLTACWQEGMP